MLNIILAFSAGALFGGLYMYTRYHRMAINNLRELRKIQLHYAKLSGTVESLATILNVDLDKRPDILKGDDTII